MWTATSAPTARKPDRAAWLLLALALLPYLNSLPNEFTNDDLPIILENRLVRHVSQIPRIFLSGYFDERDTDHVYRPLPILTYNLNYALVGERPAGFRVVNLALYTASVLLARRFTLRMFGDGRQAVFAAAIFAAHPVHAEAVVNIIGRAELLASFFGWLTLLCFLRAREAATAGAHARALGGSLFCFFLALLSKDNAIALLAVVPLCDAARALRDRQSLLTLRVSWRLYVAFLAVAVIYLAARFSAIGVLAAAHIPDTGSGSWIPLAHVPLRTRVATALTAWGGYFRLLAWPRALSAHHEVPITSAWGSLEALWPLLGVGALSVGWGWSLRRRCVEVFFGLAFAAVYFLPVSNLIIPIGPLLAERVLFMPLYGIALTLAWMLTRLPPRPAVALVAVLALAGGARTALRNLDWRDNVLLWESAQRVYPRSAHIADNLGVAYAARGDAARAEALFLLSIELGPLNWSPHLNLGNLCAQQGRWTEAERHYRRAAELNPDNYRPHFNLGLMFMQLGRIEEAIRAYRHALELDPRKSVAHNALGAALARLGRFEEAEASFRRALELDPVNENARRNLDLVRRARAHPPASTVPK